MAADSTAAMELVQITVNRIVAPIVIATFLSCALCGIVLSLAVNYCSRFPHDRLHFKLLVVFFTFAALCDTAINCSWAYRVTVRSFVNPLELANWPWQLTAFCFFTVVLICQLFFAYRVWIISGGKSHVLTGLQIAIMLGDAACAYYLGWYSTHQSSVAAFKGVSGLATAWIASGLAVDLLLTLSLVYYLFIRPRKIMGSEVHYSSPVLRIIIKSFETNAIALILQSVVLVLLLCSMHAGSLSMFTVGFLESKTYIACVLTTLNSRQSAVPPTPKPQAVTLPPLPSARSRDFGIKCPFPRSRSTMNQTAGLASVLIEISHDVAIDEGSGDVCEREKQRAREKRGVGDAGEEEKEVGVY
ncbi:hypothetical protein JCM11641_001968 [Rhodosporidiobolus odoratus]